MEILLEHDANLLIRDSNGMTAVDLADKCGHVKCVEILKDAASKFLEKFIVLYYFYLSLVN